MFLNYCKDSKRDTNGVTEAAIRSFIRQQLIGCTHRTVFGFVEVEYKFQLYIFQGHGFKKMSSRNLMSVSTKIYMLNHIYVVFLIHFLNIVITMNTTIVMGQLVKLSD